jgi:hypothetical protein
MRPVRNIFPALILVCLVVSGLSGCSVREKIPRLSVGVLSGMDAGDPAVPQILGRLQTLLLLVEEGKLSDLPAMVSAEKGLYIDLKSHRKHADLVREVANADGYLNVTFLRTDRLREQSGDSSRLSVRDVIRTTREIQVDFFREGETEVELKLHLVDNPEMNFHLNNPVFIKEGSTWLVYRLF